MQIIHCKAKNFRQNLDHDPCSGIFHDIQSMLETHKFSQIGTLMVKQKLVWNSLSATFKYKPQHHVRNMECQPKPGSCWKTSFFTVIWKLMKYSLRRKRNTTTANKALLSNSTMGSTHGNWTMESRVSWSCWPAQFYHQTDSLPHGYQLTQANENFTNA